MSCRTPRRCARYPNSRKSMMAIVPTTAEMATTWTHSSSGNAIAPCDIASASGVLERFSRKESKLMCYLSGPPSRDIRDPTSTENHRHPKNQQPPGQRLGRLPLALVRRPQERSAQVNAQEHTT